MRRLLNRYFLYRRRRLRAALRDSGYKFGPGEWVICNAEQMKLWKKYESLGRKLMAQVLQQEWIDAPFGADISGKSIVDEDGESYNKYQLGDYVLGGPDSEEKYLVAEYHTTTVHARRPDGTVEFYSFLTGPGEEISDAQFFENTEGNIVD